MENLVNDIERIVRTNYTVKVDDKVFSERKMFVVDDVKRPPLMNVNSLTAITDFVLSGSEVDPTNQGMELLIHVKDEETVSLYETYNPETGFRNELMQASCLRGRTSFKFNEWHELEAFRIMVLSLLRPNKGQEWLLEFLTKVDVGGEIKYSDDGISQEVTARQGVSGALKAFEKSRPILTLTPFRTFLEVEQPSSDFLFRVKTSGERAVCGLFEADGGAWKLAAMGNIKKWLEGKTKTIPVIC